jgi:hypothetical protein
MAVMDVLKEWRRFVDATKEPAMFDSLEAARIAGHVLASARSLQRMLDPTDPRSEHARAAESSTLAAERLSIEVLGAQLADNEASSRSLSLQSFNALVSAGESLQSALQADPEDSETQQIDLTSPVTTTEDAVIELDEAIDLREESQILSAVKPGLEVDGAALRRAVSGDDAQPPTDTIDQQAPELQPEADSPDELEADLVIEALADDLVIEPDPRRTDTVHIGLPEIDTESVPDVDVEPAVTLAATPIEAEIDEVVHAAPVPEPQEEMIDGSWWERRRFLADRKRQDRVRRVEALRAEREVVRRNHMERLAAGHDVTVRSRSRLFFRIVNAVLVGAVMVGVVIGGALLAAYVSRTWF